jgi:NTE family protein
MRRGLALGCGGILGAAWTVGVLAALEEREGWDPRNADAIIGTSAGSEYGAMLAGGVPVADLAAAQGGSNEAPEWLRAHLAAAPRAYPPLPLPIPTAPRLAFRRGLPRLTRLAGLVPTGRGSNERMSKLGAHLSNGRGWVDHPAFFVVAVDLTTGRRVVFGADTDPPATLAEAITASWAVPGCFPPVRIDGHRYIDGGAASAASPDLLLQHAPNLDEIIVIAPMSSTPVPPPTTRAMKLEGRLRRQFSTGLATECHHLQSTGVRVRRFEMSPESLHLAGPNFNNPHHRQTIFKQSLKEHLEAPLR